jgi:hypothetical protein
MEVHLGNPKSGIWLGALDVVQGELSIESVAGDVRVTWGAQPCKMLRVKVVTSKLPLLRLKLVASN